MRCASRVNDTAMALDVHEPPDCIGTSKAVAKLCMCNSIEPSIYLPGQRGITIQDLIVVTEEGLKF